LAPDICGLTDTAEVETTIIETPNIDELSIEVEDIVCLGNPVFVVVFGSLLTFQMEITMYSLILLDLIAYQKH